MTDTGKDRAGSKLKETEREKKRRKSTIYKEKKNDKNRRNG